MKSDMNNLCKSTNIVELLCPDNKMIDMECDFMNFDVCDLMDSEFLDCVPHSGFPDFPKSGFRNAQNLDFGTPTK